MKKRRVIIIVVLLILIASLSPQMINILNSPKAAEVDLNPLQREIDFDFNELFLLGDAVNLEVEEGSLVLSRIDGINYHESGHWISPVFDTNNNHTMWDWISADTDFAGMQENLIENGNISDVSCSSWGHPRPCSFYFDSTCEPPYFEDFNGNKAIRFAYNGSLLDSSAYVNVKTRNFDDTIPMHVLFDFKLDTDGSDMEFWYRTHNSSGLVYNGAIMRYAHPISNFEQQYFVINASQLRDYQPLLNASLQFFSYYRNDDYPKTAWIDNVIMFQDSPISFQVRTSDNGVDWSDWNEERYLVANKVAPGGRISRYVQFRIDIERDPSIMETPKLNSLRLDYSKVFPFEISWDYQGEAVFDEEIANIDDKGFVSITPDGNLRLEDGEEIAFWATQAEGYSDWMPLDQMESACKKLRQMGFNMIKTTYTPWAINEMNRFLKECKEEGVYIYYQVGGSVDHQLFENISEHAQEYVDIMETTNPLTGVEYGQDPQYVFMQLLNEVRIHSRWRSGKNWTEWGVPNIKYNLYEGWVGENSDELWKQWLSNKYPNYVQLESAWNDGSASVVFYPDENGNDYPRNIRKTRFEDWDEMSHTRFRDTDEFYSWIHERYYMNATNRLRDSDVKTLILPNNHFYGLGELKARLDTDIIDQHNYFSYVRIPENYGEFNELVPQVKSPFYNAITYATLLDTKGYPLTQSESNHNNPSLYTSEFPLFLSVYGSFHDWDQWTFFKTHGADYTDERNRFFRTFEDLYSPDRMAFMPAASRIFRYRYITPGDNVIELNHTNETVYNYQFDRSNRQFSVPGLYPNIGMENRITRNNFEAEVDLTKDDYYDLYGVSEPDNPYVTSNGQLYLDSERGYLLINAPKAQGFSGFTQSNLIGGDYLDISIPPKGNNFSTMVMIPLDDIDLSESEHILLTASGRGENNDTEWSPDKRGFSHDKRYHYNDNYYWGHFGRPPSFVEGINAELSLLTSASEATINILDSNGQRTGETVDSILEGGRLDFNISDMYETLWYEIVLSIPGPVQDPNPPSNNNNNNNNGDDDCGNDVCDIDEDCETCEVDCGPCIPNPPQNNTSGPNLVYLDYDLFTYLETSGGQYDLIIDDMHYLSSIYGITYDELKFLYEGDIYTIPLGDYRIVNINGHELKIYYFDYSNPNAEIIFSLEKEETLTAYASDEFIYFALFGLGYLLIFLLIMSLRKKPIKRRYSTGTHLNLNR